MTLFYNIILEDKKKLICKTYGSIRDGSQDFIQIHPRYFYVIQTDQHVSWNENNLQMYICDRQLESPQSEAN